MRVNTLPEVTHLEIKLQFGPSGSWVCTVTHCAVSPGKAVPCQASQAKGDLYWQSIWKTAQLEVQWWKGVCLRSPDYLQIWWLTRMTQETQKKFRLMVITYYRERIQIRISKGKRCIVQSPGETRHELLVVLFPENCMDRASSSQQQYITTWMKCCPGKLIWALACTVFSGGQSCRHSVPCGWLCLFGL